MYYAQGPATKRFKTSEKLDYNLRRANIIKPQNLFERKPDNNLTGPWKPLLTKKPHAKIPLDESLATFEDEFETIQYGHPFAFSLLVQQRQEVLLN